MIPIELEFIAKLITNATDHSTPDLFIAVSEGNAWIALEPTGICYELHPVQARQVSLFLWNAANAAQMQPLLADDHDPRADGGTA